MRTPEPWAARRARTAFALAGVLVCAIAVGATRYRPLAGEYRVGGATLVDAPPGEPQDTHLHVVLTGSAARDLYHAMKTRPRSDACGENGALVKSVGDMQCRRERDRYECAFAVDIARQRIAPGSVC